MQRKGLCRRLAKCNREMDTMPRPISVAAWLETQCLDSSVHRLPLRVKKEATQRPSPLRIVKEIVVVYSCEGLTYVLLKCPVCLPQGR